MSTNTNYIKSTCCYKFLFEKPISYVRPISSTENAITRVKFLIVSYNKMCEAYIVCLYEDNKNVNWENVITKKVGHIRLNSNDCFFLDENEFDGFLQYFGIK